MSAKHVVPERIISAHERRVPRRDEVRADECPFDGHHVTHQPDIEPEVVGKTPQQRHRGVCMRVDEPRHDHPALTIDDVDGFHL